MEAIEQIGIFEGIWEKNYLSGFGRQIDCDGNIYIGEYTKGKKNN